MDFSYLISKIIIVNKETTFLSKLCFDICYMYLKADY